MSKKFFLKKSFAEAAKTGLEEKANSANFVQKQLKQEQPDFEDYNPGQSVIRSKYIGFPYRDLSKQTCTPKESPVKRKKVTKRVVSKVLNKTYGDDDDDVFTVEDICVATPTSSPEKKKQKKEPEVIVLSSDSDMSPVKESMTVETGREAVKQQIQFQLSDSDSDSLPDPNQFKETVFYYDNDKTLPIFRTMESGIKTLDAVKCLMSHIDEQYICTSVPTNIAKNVCFILNENKLGHWKDVMSDNMGVWKQTCTSKKNVIREDGSYRITLNDANTIKVFRYQYVNQSSPDLHRIIIRIQPLPGHFDDNILVQYYFDGKEHDVRVKSHKSSKLGEPYFRTMESTKQKIKTECVDQKPKQLFHKILEEKGGILNVQSPSQIARDRQQITNFKRTDKPDPILEVMDMAKNEKEIDSIFIRDVSTSPELCIFLATDDQLQDLLKYCTNPSNFGLLGIDTTFNIGDYYVTITTYRNLMCKSAKGIEPVMIGPTLIHQRRHFESFYSLASNIVKCNPELSKILAFGTDGEDNIGKAFETCMPFAFHLLCDIHMKDNVKAKLKNLGISGGDEHEIISDIFGAQNELSQIPGLVDCKDVEQFKDRLSALEKKWSEKHTNGLKFAEYFRKHKAGYIRCCMSAEVRSMCGLGYPPKPYTQNANECMNSVVKKDMNSKNMTIPEFIRSVKRTVTRQHQEIMLSICGMGVYQLNQEYKHLKIEASKYFRMTKYQKLNAYNRVLQTELTVRHSTNDNEAEDVTDEILSAEITPTEILPADYKNLSLTPEKSQIVHVPFPILKSIFEKASTLLEDSENISRFPGQSDQNKSKFLITSASNPLQPHTVTVFQSGQVTCDNACASWKAYSICSHCIAVSDSKNKLPAFLLWFNKTKKDVSISELSLFNMPKGRGKKPQKSTQLRKGPTNVTKASPLEYAFDNPFSSEPVVQPPPPPKPHDGGYIIYMLEFCDKRVSKCHGCKGELKPEGKLPNPPRDVVVSRTRRKYVKDGVERLGEIGNVYFHFNENCIKSSNKYFIPSLIFVPPEIIPHLQQKHKQLLEKSGVTLPVDI